MQIREYKPEKILSETVLNFSKYVINPYRGCQFGCLYCYAKSFKAIQKRLKNNFSYGEFVDVKINAVELLEKELKEKKIESVILGASTEVYQPIEEKYCLTQKIISLLNQYDVKIFLLTKSDLICRDLSLLKPDKTIIFFTINSTNDTVFSVFENNSPSYQKRLNALQKLFEAKIKVVLHIGPVLPFLSDYERIIIETMQYVYSYEFENLNLNSINKELFLEKIKLNFSQYYDYYLDFFYKVDVYKTYLTDLEKNLKKIFENNKKRYYTFFHPVDNFFNNKLYPDGK